MSYIKNFIFLWIMFSPLSSQELTSLSAHSHNRPLLSANIILPDNPTVVFFTNVEISLNFLKWCIMHIMYYEQLWWIIYIMWCYYIIICNYVIDFGPSNMSNCNGLISYILSFNWRLKLKPCMNRFGDSCWVHMHLLKWLWG